MKEQLEIMFHDPNDKEETVTYLSNLVVDMLVEQAKENPKKFLEIVSSLMDGGDSENSSLL